GFERLHDARPVAPLLHINEVEHDDSAEVAQADLANDLFGRFEVGLDDGVFEAVRAPDEFAGVDVNRDQRFGLIDDDVTAGLEPDARLDGFINLILNAVLFEDRRVFGVELDAAGEFR